MSEEEAWQMQSGGGGHDGSSSGGSSGGGGGGRGADPGSAVMRKGPWMAEEDEILMEYVRQHGPRDWSSIRSKGLLPRTGKSCRLRWVNKLKPDLKTGCKFSAEEERIVIDLQARFGNKWARIATYLPGRTDNDVKNFWSTRQKRLARILHAPLPTKSNRSHGTLTLPHQLPSLKRLSLDRAQLEGDSPNSQCSAIFHYTDHNPNAMVTQMPDLASQDLLDLDATLPLLAPAIDRVEPCASHTPPLPLQVIIPFDHLLDLPLLPEGPDLIPGLGEDAELPFYGLEAEQHGVRREDEQLDGFFNDFPADMFDYLEPPPPPPPPAPSASW